MTIYLITHGFNVDGGFGDPIYKEETLFATTDRELAEAYCHKWNDHHIFEAHPWGYFSKNHIFVKEMTLNNDFTIDTLPPVNSNYEIRKERFPAEYEKRRKDLTSLRKNEEIQRRKRQREAQVDEWKAACAAVGCTFTPA